jgi:hypothetical protein
MDAFTLLFALFYLASSHSRIVLPFSRHLQTCGHLCLRCESSDTCLACDNYAHLDAGKCLCNARYYFQGGYGCIECPSACAACSDSKCDECSSAAKMDTASALVPPYGAEMLVHVNAKKGSFSLRPLRTVFSARPIV